MASTLDRLSNICLSVKLRNYFANNGHSELETLTWNEFLKAFKQTFAPSYDSVTVTKYKLMVQCIKEIFDQKVLLTFEFQDKMAILALKYLKTHDIPNFSGLFTINYNIIKKITDQGKIWYIIEEFKLEDIDYLKIIKHCITHTDDYVLSMVLEHSKDRLTIEERWECLNIALNMKSPLELKQKTKNLLLIFEFKEKDLEVCVQQLYEHGGCTTQNKKVLDFFSRIGIHYKSKHMPVVFSSPTLETSK